MKCLLKLAVVFVLGLALVIGLGVFGLESVLSTLVTEGITYTTQQDTQLKGTEIGFTSGHFGFEDLSIANPEGFEDGPMLAVHAFKVQLKSNIMQGNVLQIEELSLGGFELALEMKGSESNVGALMERLDELKQTYAPEDSEASETIAEDSQPQTAEEAPQGEESAVTQTESSAPSEDKVEIHIDRIRITDVKASLRISGIPAIDGVYEVEVPDLLLEDFGTDMNEAEMSEWTIYVLEAVLLKALDAGDDVFPLPWQSLLKGELNTEVLKESLDEAKAEFEAKAEEAVDQLIKDVNENPAGAAEALKGTEKDLLKSLKGGAKSLKDRFKKN